MQTEGSINRDPGSPDHLHVQLDEVHVIEFRLDPPLDSARQLLDDSERERAARFVFERDCQRFVAAHALLRLALGACLDRPPESLRFATTGKGKPRLVNAPVDLRFNLSHAGDRALLAIALQQEVGVDIEEQRPVDVFALAERFFSRSESEAIRRLPPREYAAGFFRCWTRKEAFIKALGDGLSFPLDDFEVSIDDNGAAQQLRSCSALPDAIRQWRVVGVPTDPPYVAAVAAGPGDWRVVKWSASVDHRGRPLRMERV